MLLTVRTLLAGLLALVALLLVVGMFGAVGSIELAIWLVLVAAWVALWSSSRRARRTSS